MRNKLILLNGPPGSGKDTIANEIAFRYYDTEVRSHKKFLLELTAMIFGVDLEKFLSLYDDRTQKETQQECLEGNTPRGALIYVAEQVMKPMFGSDYFSKRDFKNITHGTTIFSDSGFESEVEAALEVFEPQDILILQLEREGCSYVGDSRNYIYGNGLIDVARVRNTDGYLRDTVHLIEKIIDDFLLHSA